MSKKTWAPIAEVEFEAGRSYYVRFSDGGIDLIEYVSSSDNLDLSRLTGVFAAGPIPLAPPWPNPGPESFSLGDHPDAQPWQIVDKDTPCVVTIDEGKP